MHSILETPTNERQDEIATWTHPGITTDTDGVLGKQGTSGMEAWSRARGGSMLGPCAACTSMGLANAPSTLNTCPQRASCHHSSSQLRVTAEGTLMPVALKTC